MYFKKIFLAATLIGFLIAGYFSYRIYKIVMTPNTNFNNQEATIFIRTGETYPELRDDLILLLKSIENFDVLAERKGYINNLKAGKYILTKGMNNNNIINTLRTANVPVRVSFNNQENIYALAGRISNQIESDSISLLSKMLDPTFLTNQNLNEETILSYFIPNTYEFFWNTSATKFIERMEIEYHRFWNTERLSKAKRLGLTPAEVAILASIVQKETTKRDEMPRVAGVYLNRLEKGWKLQADPTVIYAMKIVSGNFDLVIKRVLLKDLEIDSPYNTYKYAGLPPGLIAMPDIVTLDAVLNAEEHTYFYFVADVDNLGYHKFAKTLQQHNQNRVKYQKWIRKQGILR